MKRLAFALVTAAALLLGGQSSALAAAPVVVNQVYGGGGNTNAPYTHDFIELFNRSDATVSLSGWSVQYASATGTGNFGATSAQISELSGSLVPGQYLLIQESGGTNGSPLPAADVTDATPIAMSATAGKVALVNTTTPLGCNGGSTPCGPGQFSQIIDLVGYGGANFFEGTGPTPAPSNTTSVSRTAAGCNDTDDNASDFAVGTPMPRNSASPFVFCGESAPSVTATTPTNSASDAPVDGNISITFSEPVNVAGGWFTLSCSASGSHTATVSGGPTTLTLDPDVDFSLGESCTVTVSAARVSDVDILDPPDTMAADYTFTFSTASSCALPYTPAYEIQGTGPAAAITGNVTTQGVVVGDFEGSSGLGGFYLQDATGDGIPASSDGIFVFTGSADTVSAGQLVRVTGYARERFSQTALNGSDNNSAAVPAANIVGCGSGSVPSTDVIMPFTSVDYPERFEGMLVRLPQSLVISEYFNYERFGELVLGLPLAGESRPFTPTAIEEPGAPAQARAVANTLRRITLDDGLGIQNPSFVRHPSGEFFALTNRFRGGDTVENTVGVIGFDLGLYRIQPTGPADYTATNPRPPAPEPVGGDVRVAAMNTLNFFLTLDYPTGDPLDNKCGPAQNQECRGADADQPSEFTRQRDKLLAAISGLGGDVTGLNELENTTGVDPLADPAKGIVAGLNAMLGAGTYAAITTGTIGTDAIRVGLIYKPAKVMPVGDFKVLTTAVDPRFLDTKNRPVLAQTFEVVATGAHFTAVVNHLKSKGSDCNDVADPDIGDGQGNCNLTRKKAAQALVDWLAADPTGSGDPDFLIIGDLNSYAKEDPIDAIRAGSDDTSGTSDDYTNLIAQYQGTYAYSYVFDGQAGYLDHALASSSLASQVTGASEWHINADEPDLLDYDTSFKPPTQDAIYEPNGYRSSDHDPLIVGLSPCEEAPPTLSVNASPSTLFPPNHQYQTVNTSVAASDNSGLAPTVTLVSVTSNEPDDAPGDADGKTKNDILIVDQDTFRLRAERSENGSGRIYTITYKATDACGNATTASATVTVPVRS
jgi:predicted extracellular nuclease